MNVESLRQCLGKDMLIAGAIARATPVWCETTEIYEGQDREIECPVFARLHKVARGEWLSRRERQGGQAERSLSMDEKIGLS